MNFPYLTRDLPGIGGLIKQRPEDFFVQELPLYEPQGEGEHLYVEIQKVGMTTFQAIDRICSSLDIPRVDVGYAGLKDAQAVTRQVFSLRGVKDDQVARLASPKFQVLWAMRHRNKIKLGHLAGNRFAIKIRDVQAGDVLRAKPILDELVRRGLPNFYGEQRFGRRGDNHVLGGALIRGRPQELLNRLLGAANPTLDGPDELQARHAFDAGDLERSMHAWPRHAGMERRVLARLIKTRNPGQAVRWIDPHIRRLWVSALQSHLFNDVLGRRVESVDRLFPGDLAYKHENGACFAVEDPAVEQPRCDAFEISPTGPIVGHRMTLPQGQALELETAAMKAHGLTPGHFKQEGRDQAKGARRPLRVPVKDLEYVGGGDEHGPHITLAFTLPPGAYATVLLGEVMKNQAEPNAAMPGPANPMPEQDPEPLE